MAQEWFIQRNGQKYGPFSTEQIKEFAASGKLSPQDGLCKEGQTDWAAAGTFNGLFPAKSALPEGERQSSIQYVEPLPWYFHPAIIGLGLVFFFPLGIYLLWKRPSENNTVKIAVTAVFALLILIGVIKDKKDVRKEIISESIAGNSSITEAANSPAPEKIRKKININSGLSSKPFPMIMSGTDGPVGKYNISIFMKRFDIGIDPQLDSKSEYKPAILEDETITEQYYPFIPGTYCPFVRFQGTLQGKKGFFIHERGEIEHLMENRIARTRNCRERYRLDGYVDDMKTYLTEFTENDKDEARKHPVVIRVKDGFVQQVSLPGIPLESVSETSWQPVLKIGAKKEDTWSHSDNGFDTQYDVVAFLACGDQKYVIVQAKTKMPDGAKSNTVTWYCEGVGPV